jgi:hypothetical protein
MEQEKKAFISIVLVIKDGGHMRTPLSGVK